MPKKLHVHGLKIALQLLAVLAAQRSGGSRHACLGRHISLPSLGAENPRQAQRRWRGRVGASLGSALSRRLECVAPGLRPRLPGCGRACFSPGCPALVRHQCSGGANDWGRGRAACRGRSGVAHRSPRAGPAGSSCPGGSRGGVLPAASSGHRPSPHAGTRTFPRTAGAAPLLSDGWCWQFIRCNYAN